MLRYLWWWRRTTRLVRLPPSSAIIPSTTARLVIDVVVRHSLLLLAFRIFRHAIIVEFFFGEFGDDVPCVQETGDEAQAAEEDVDEGVGGAQAAFDPDGDRGEDDGEDAEEDVAAGHGGWFDLEVWWVDIGCVVRVGGFVDVRMIEEEEGRVDTWF